MAFSKEPEYEEPSMDETPPTNGNTHLSIEDIEKIKENLKNIRINSKVEYLESWRRDYIERINKVIDWAVKDPGNYLDVTTMMYKFEDFFMQLMMFLGQSETIKESWEDIKKQRRRKSNMEVG